MDNSSSSSTQTLAFGAAFWCVFAFVALWLRGVRWDENYEFAQAMTGAVAYPAAHPLVLYTRNAFNGQFAFAGFMELLFDSPTLLNGYRNLLFIIATVVPAFLLGAVVSGRVLIGHIAAVLVLQGLHLEFDGAYPQMVWPGMFSNGHVATGFALATIALFASGYLRVASLMLGLMPLVHLGQTPTLMLLALAYGIFALRSGQIEELKTGLAWLVTGLAVCATVFGITRAYAVNPIEVGGYSGTLTAQEAWHGIVLHHDMHRQIPVGNSHIIPFLLVAVWWSGRPAQTSRLRRAWNWIGVYSASVILIVYGVMFAHAIVGADAPYLMIGWLPYRLANHLPPILIAFVAAALWNAAEVADDDRHLSLAPWMIAGVLAFLFARPWLSQVIPQNLFDRYLASTDSLLYLACGAVVGLKIHACRGSKAFRIETVAAVAGILVLATVHQFGALCSALGLAIGIAVPRVPRSIPGAYVTCAALVVALVASILYEQRAAKTHLPIGDFEARVTNLLAERGEEDAMIAGPPYQLMLQAQTGHPILADMATHYHGSYMPSLAPVVHTLYQRVYGIALDQPQDAQPNWEEVWSTRTQAEWETLAQDFGFRFVVAPNTVTAKLQRLVLCENDSLYAVFEAP